MTSNSIILTAHELPLALSGDPFQIRRVVEPQPKWSIVKGGPTGWFDGDCMDKEYKRPLTCPFGDPGDRLWVQEDRRLVYSADGADSPHSLYSAESMPRGCSRLTLEVLRVWVERLQDRTLERHVPYESNPYVWAGEFRGE